LPLPQKRQSGRPAEPEQGVVGEDYLSLISIERGADRLRGIHSLKRGVVTATPQLAQDRRGNRLGIFSGFCFAQYELRNAHLDLRFEVRAADH
jgi:hypothetical protein